MQKGINLQGKIHLTSGGATAQSVVSALPAVFAKANPGLQLRVTGVSQPDEGGTASIRVYITGDQDPASDFAALARAALKKAIAETNSGSSGTGGSKQSGTEPQKPAVQLHSVEEVEGDADSTGAVLPPDGSALSSESTPVAKSGAADLPLQAADPPPTDSGSTDHSSSKSSRKKSHPHSKH